MSILLHRAILVEDEPLARARLHRLLQPYAHQIEIIGEATDGQEGLDLANTLKPDLIFLDVQMPLMDGFEMLQKLSYSPHIIFTTAFDQYAIKAFEENSIDYLLKPIDEERLKRSMQKLEGLSQATEKAGIKQLLHQLNTSPIKTLTVSLGDRMLLVKLVDIVYFKAEEKYVFAYDKMGKRYLLSKSLKELESVLNDSFIRVHRTYIINCDFIHEIQKSFKATLTFVMNDLNSTSISSSQGYTPAIRARFLM